MGSNKRTFSIRHLSCRMTVVWSTSDRNGMRLDHSSGERREGRDYKIRATLIGARSRPDLAPPPDQHLIYRALVRSGKTTFLMELGHRHM
jgi:hypothetical protein